MPTLQKPPQVLNHPIRPAVIAQVLRLRRGGDASKGQNRLHPQPFAAGDIRFEIVANQQAILRLYIELVTEIVKENQLGFAAEKRRDVGRIGEKSAEGAASEFNAAWAGIDAIGTDAN